MPLDLDWHLLIGDASALPVPNRPPDGVLGSPSSLGMGGPAPSSSAA